VAILPARAIAPVSKARRSALLDPGETLAALTGDGAGDGALTLRLWPATRRDLAALPDRRPPPASPLAMLAARFGLAAAEALPARPAADPADTRAAEAAAEAAPGDGAPVDDPLAALGSRIASLADLGGRAPDLAAAAHLRFDCDILAVDVDGSGAFPASPSDRVDAYRAALSAAGVPEDRIRVARAPGDLRPVDAILNLGFFGATAKVGRLGPFLDALCHADTTMLTDIRKGSGAWPWLRGRGTVTVLATAGDMTRALFRPDPPSAPPETAPPETAPASAPAAGDTWPAIARDLAGPEGFYTEGAGHSFLFIPRGPTLVVTFDNLDIAMTRREDRRPWGYRFIEKQGFSMLGVMAGGWTWYREPWVWAEFDRLRDSGFFARFERVVFYGASMGGYAAAAFVPACPGADVVAISPQSTLDRATVPWETRYRTAWGRDFSGPYGDAAVVSASARRVTILYDPYEPLDAAHAARFTGRNVVRLRAPLLGHRLGSALHQMGILSPIVLAALDGSLTPAAFYRALRARRDFPRYQRELFARAAERHPALARRLGAWVLARSDHRAIREAMRRL
jgi:hypothetical protein